MQIPITSLKFMALILLAISAAACSSVYDRPIAAAPDTKRIIGGESLDESSTLARYVAKVVWRLDDGKGSRNLCTGTFLSRRVLLTAAHCVPEQNRPDLVSVEKRASSSAKPETFKVRAYIRHSDYIEAPNRQADLALILLDSDVAGAKAAQFRAELPAQSNSFRFVALGYGRTTNEPTKASGSGELKVNTFHALFYEPDLYYFKSRLNDDNGVCNGDSGGPALMEVNGGVVIFGVASTAEAANGKICNFSAKYMNIAFYREWIEQALKQ